MNTTLPSLRSSCLALLLCALGMSVGCKSDEPTATFIAPQLGEPCRFADCGDHGVCVQAESGDPTCACDDGFAGDHCEHVVCASGFHWDSQHHCTQDRHCEEQPTDPCGAHGACDDDLGVIACECDQGYEGPRCNLCTSGYARNENEDCLQVVIGPGCSPGVCGAHGDCEEHEGKAVCLCDVGYVGDVCSKCSAGFHEGTPGLCTIDESCLDSSCSGHGLCSVNAGQIVCACNPEYDGKHCDTCAEGNHRQDDGSCMSDPTCGETTKDYGPLDFNALATFPNAFESCIAATDDVSFDALSLRSTTGTGTVWKCGPSLLYSLTSRHVVLEAGATSPAQLLFGGNLSQVHFAYAARQGALSLDVVADGKVIGSLTKPNNGMGSFSSDFDPPISMLELRSKSGVTSQIAIDDISYTLVSCEP